MSQNKRRTTPRSWRTAWDIVGCVSRSARARVSGGLLCAAIGIVSLSGCASTRVTDPVRTATEQFLLSYAATEAVGQLSFDVLRGRLVWVETRYFAASEEAFVLGELRARLLLSGVQLVQTRGESEVVLEVRSGGVGIDRNDFLLGIPSFTAPVSTPELALLKHTNQRGFASVSYVAYWSDTGEVVASSGPFIGRTSRDDYWFFGVGPRSLGDIPPVRRAPEERQRPGEGTARPPGAESPAGVSGDAAAGGAGGREP